MAIFCPEAPPPPCIPFPSASPTAATATREYVNAVLEGADPTGTTPSSAPIQAAITKAVTDHAGGVFLPRGVYLIDQMITYQGANPLSIVGAGAVLKVALPADAEGPLEAVLRVGVEGATSAGSAFLRLEGLTLDANGAAEYGLRAWAMVGRGSALDQITCQCALSTGFQLVDCQGLGVRRCLARNNGGDGFRLRGCNASLFEGCVAQDNLGSGFVVAPFPTLRKPDGSLRHGGTGGCYLVGCSARGNHGHGVSLVRELDSPTYTVGPGLAAAKRTGTVIRDGWFEGNRCDGIRIAVWNTTVWGNRIRAAAATASNARALRAVSDTYWTNVQSNVVWASETQPDFARYQLEGPPLPMGSGDLLDQHYVQGNFVFDPMDPMFGGAYLPVMTGATEDHVCPVEYGTGA